MPLKLFYAPGACSFVPHTLLETSGVPFEAIHVKVHKGEQHSPDYLAINPRGQVPALQDGAEVVTQIVAIALYLDDRFPQCDFLPREPVARARALETLMWMNNTVHPTFTHFFMPAKFADDSAVHEAMKAFNTGLYAKQLGEIEAMVKRLDAATPFLSGAHFGPLDAYALTLLRWGGFMGHDPEGFPALWAHVQRVAQLPPVARAIERERLKVNVYQAS